MGWSAPAELVPERHGAAVCPLGSRFGHVTPQEISWRLPHQEGPTSDACGELVWVGHLDDDGELWHAWCVPHDCGQRDCGRCRSSRRQDGSWVLRGWEKREGAVISDRWKAWLGSARAGPPVLHVVISPPQRNAAIAVASDVGYRELRAELRAVADWVGVDAACAIFHPTRIPSKWNDRELCSSGPHFHLLCTAHARGRNGFVDGRRVALLSGKQTLLDPAPVDDLEHPLVGSGWVVKNLGPRDSVYATAAYLLSHAGLSRLSGDLSATAPSPVQTVTWWGWAKDWPMRTSSIPEEIDRLCPVCDQKIWSARVCILQWVDGVPDPPAPGSGLRVAKSAAVTKRTLKDEWEDWRRNNEIYHFTPDQSGPGMMATPPPMPGGNRK